MGNILDPDQTAPLEATMSTLTMFAHACMFENLAL